MEAAGRRAPESSSWQSADAQVLVEDLSAPELSDGVAHHLSRALRLRAGATICATDGAGGWVECRFDGAASLSPLGPVSVAPRSSPEVSVGFALVKAQKPELVVQKLTELGVDRIAIFAARRSVVRWDEQRESRNLDRLRRVAVEACSQCRRLWLPEIEMSTLASLVAAGAILADVGGRELLGSDTAVLIGPEGGWDPADLDELGVVDGASVGPPDRVRLGEHVLRAETAAIVAGVLLTARRC